MERFIANLVKDYESGKVDRREFCKTVALAATVYAAGDTAMAQAPRGFKMIGINHISYTCPNFRQAADWYSKIFNLDQIGARDRDVALPFGKKGEQPYNVAAKDVPLTHLIFRTRDLNPASAPGEPPRPKVQATVDHVAYTVADFDRERAKAELKSLGVENVRDGGLYSLHMTDPFGYDVQISGLANNALTDG